MSPEVSANSSWEEIADYNISAFSELPHRHFGFNQHMIVNAEFKEALRQVLWQFRAPIRYAFAYGSGVFPQSRSVPDPLPPSPHPHAPEAVTKWQKFGEKNIDFIFGVSYTQHWHSLNLNQHRNHYSFLGSFGSGVVKRVQDSWSPGAYFNPYVKCNGLSIKYGVVNLDTLYRDLAEWDTLYLAGRLQKPVKILRDDPRIRLANQVNLISALRTALLMLPPRFTERDLYFKIAALSYIGDPRIAFRAERPDKVFGIVDSQMTNFRKLYFPLVADLPNVTFEASEFNRPGDWMDSPDVNCPLSQDMDPTKRGNMVRRLPPAFRRKLYEAYRRAFNVSPQDFHDIIAQSKNEDAFSRRTCGDFDKRIATAEGIEKAMGQAIQKTVMWPTVSMSLKGILTAGPLNSWKYLSEKRSKGQQKPVGSTDKSTSTEDGSAISRGSRPSERPRDEGGKAQHEKKTE